MHWIDWTIVAILAAALTTFSLISVRYMKGVADFLSANRSAGRYLLTIAGSMSNVGAISVVAMFEVHLEAGFPPFWWALMSVPISVVIIMSGWVYYRFRETRCMTLAQFFEKRYSRRFRIYHGLVAWISGVVNFGIFPAVAARFFVYFCGLPPAFTLAGLTIPTYAPIMLLTLGLALAYTCLGGQITVIVTDCVQGIFCGFVFVLICGFILWRFDWSMVTTTLMTAEEGKSLLHPYETSGVENFNVWFFLIGIFGTFYSYMSWQGAAGYACSGLNPHEQKMGQIIGIWRGFPQTLMIVLLPMAALTVLRLPAFADSAAAIRASLDLIENETIRTQMTTPVALSVILPPVLKGLFCSVMIFFLITTQDTYLHSWGSMFIQDVVLPFRKKPFTPEQHVMLLRGSIIFVAMFAFVFSLLFRQSEHIMMFFAITGAIVSGSGACVIGGLYWRRGTAVAAWTAMTLGWTLAVGRIVLQQVAPRFEGINQRGRALQVMDAINAVNSQWIWLWIMVACIGSYIFVSLLTSRTSFNLDRMLHRGRYDDAHEHEAAVDAKRSLAWRIMGITDEFSRGDRRLAVLLFAWNFGWFGAFLIITAWNLIAPWQTETWARFWQVWVWLYFGIGVPTTVWFAIGGVRDIRAMFVRLAEVARDETDDGQERQAPESY